MTTNEILESLKRTLSGADRDIVCAYLYGSRARGEARSTSDVDVAVLFDQHPPPTLDGLRFDLTSRLENTLRVPVDLLVLNAAPADLVHRVLRDGIVIVENDRAARVRFEVSARNSYFDLLPILGRYRRGNLGQVA
ncbi:MAG: nucleotidyltransferase domain-containing protein [Gammaproteobacteria bacterium]|nr:nucleotidyltransferase domain-containing protein [Gammaproteobacteria bacterium]